MISVKDIFEYAGWVLTAIGIISFIYGLIIKPTRKNKELQRKIKELETTLSEIRSSFNKEKYVSKRYSEIIKEIVIKLDISYQSKTINHEKLNALMELGITSIRLIENNEANYKEL